MPGFSSVAPFLLLQVQATAPDSALLYAGLERGRHAAGYRVVEIVDRSRHAIVPASVGRAVVPRQLRVHLWFPAAESRRATLRFSQLIQGSDSALRAHVIELGGAADNATSGLTRLGRTPTWSRRGATPRPGRHPLVLIAAYLPPGTVSVMAEYLASHGYVVGVVPLRGVDAEPPEISLRGVESQAADLQLATQELARLPFVDDDRLALMGTGINASGALAYALRSERVGALISLEGGITTPFELRMLRGTTTFDARRLRVPMLVVTAPHPDVDAARLDIYRSAAQYRLHLGGTGEFWLLNFGVMEALAPALIGRPPGDVRSAYLTASRYVERFLAATLRDEPSAQRFLAAAPPAGWLTGGSRYAARPPSPPALSRAVLLDLLATEGVAVLARRIRVELPRDPDPVTSADFIALDGVLARRGESALADRLTLARLRGEIHPASARAQLSLARLHLAMRDSANASVSAARAAELLAADGDPALDGELRAQVLDLARRLQRPRGEDPIRR